MMMLNIAAADFTHASLVLAVMSLILIPSSVLPMIGSVGVSKASSCIRPRIMVIPNLTAGVVVLASLLLTLSWD
jgi:hypothetical protein